MTPQMQFGSGNAHTYVGHNSVFLRYLMKVLSPLLSSLLLVGMQQVAQHYCSGNSTYFFLCWSAAVCYGSFN